MEEAEDAKEEKIEEKLSNEKKIRFVKHVTAYIGLDGVTEFGPYEEGQEEVLPKEEAEWLVENGYAIYP